MIGRKGLRSHRIVVQERREKREGRIVEQIGTVTEKPAKVTILNKERYQYWLNVGAKPTPSALKIISEPLKA